MNTLSLFLYFAEVIGSLKGLLEAGIIFGLIGTVIGSVAWLIWYNKDYRNHDNDEKINARFLQFVKTAFIIAMTSMVLYIFVPGQQTVYMIAASEMGETVWESEEAQDLYDDLRTIISNYAKGEDE